MKTWVVLAFALLASPTAFAFPDMIRHGYTQCTACHVTPNGGSLLTAYGRQLSSEIMSTWSYQNEGNLLHGLVNDPAEKGYLFGGDVRAIQFDKENPQVREGRFFLMQAEADAAVTKGKFTGYFSVGQITKPMSGTVQGNVNSTRFWGMAQVTEQVTIRAGRFLPQFGLNMPDHTLVTKTNLGFNPGMQFDTAEVAYLGESWTAFLSGAQSVDNTPKVLKEKAFVGHLAYAFWDRFKTGGSVWFGDRDDKRRHQIYSLNAQLGLTPKLFLLYDADYHVSTHQHDLLGFTRLGYEVHKGIVPFLQYQHLRMGDGTTAALARHYGIGGQFFPRPHFEIAGLFDKIHEPTGWREEAYLLAHYYF